MRLHRLQTYAAFMEAFTRGTLRAIDTIKAIPCSTVTTVLAVGAFTTKQPNSVAAYRSTLLIPTPALPTTLSWPCEPHRITLVPLFTIKAFAGLLHHYSSVLCLLQVFFSVSLRRVREGQRREGARVKMLVVVIIQDPLRINYKGDHKDYEGVFIRYAKMATH
eukprot:Gb_16425 [translate_table: standard]